MKTLVSHKQSGSVLIISLVMLVMLTLFVLTVINTTNINSRIARNMQEEAETQAAAQQAIEQVISVNFPADPQAVPVDVNIGNNKTYSVIVAKPVCTKVVPIKTVELDALNAADVPCFASSVVGSAGIISAGGPGAGSGNSLCSNSRWDVRADVPLSAAGLNATVHQGIGVRVPVGTPCPS